MEQSPQEAGEEMNITKEWLLEKDACKEGIEWFENQKEICATIVIGTLLKEERYDWADWTLSRLLTRPNLIRWAVNSAELVLPIFEKAYPTNNQPRLAIEAAKKCIDFNTEKNRDAAWSAAWSAASAARSAESAARSAAWSAARAAWSAARAAWSAARAARSAESAARSAESAASEMRLQCSQFGLGLLRGQE